MDGPQISRPRWWCVLFHQRWWAVESRRLDDNTLEIIETCLRCGRRWGGRIVEVRRR